MKTKTITLLASLLAAVFLAGAQPAAADASHARIARLSLAQGDVRYATAARNDSLADSKAVWETAVVNLPIRQGYALSTGQGRAEVEFENGTTAYLDENTVLEFYDLSLQDGGRTTRLVLQQGTASFHLQPSRYDVFTVTAREFTAEATGRSEFRIDTYDDGSAVSVGRGRVNVSTRSHTKELDKGQSLSMRAGNEASLQIGPSAPRTDFDKWVSERAETVSAATNSALQYVNSDYYYSGFGDLQRYGSWINYPGYGQCWRPFGVGMGWSPFSAGQWAFVRGLGWTWISFEPWGWAPYHFGSWLFSPVNGWVWVPNGFNRGLGWRPATAVWVRSGSRIGIVPAHPQDGRARTPGNLEHGVIAVGATLGGDTGEIRGADTEWKMVKEPPRNSVRAEAAAAAPPMRLSRTIVERDPPVGRGGVGRNGTIAFDPRERKFVNSDGPGGRPGAPERTAGPASGPTTPVDKRALDAPGNPAAKLAEREGRERDAAPSAGATMRVNPAPAPPRTFTPPPVPRSEGPRGEPQRGDSVQWSNRPDSGRSAPRATESPRSAPGPPSAPAPRSSPPPPPVPRSEGPRGEPQRGDSVQWSNRSDSGQSAPRATESPRSAPPPPPRESRSPH